MQNRKDDVNELLQCKSCDRWCSHIGKDSWVHHPYESAGLLGLCLKKLGAVSKAKILDAAWIWTEPHSKRLKLYVDVEKAVLDGKMNVQQRIVAEFSLKNKMCSDCMRSESDHSWGAMIQLRQVCAHDACFATMFVCKN
jgi:nonsense-mediated mRNA decay protein 3